MKFSQEDGKSSYFCRAAQKDLATMAVVRRTKLCVALLIVAGVTGGSKKEVVEEEPSMFDSLKSYGIKKIAEMEAQEQ